MSTKTQLIVTITQTGERQLAPSLLERDLRAIVKDIWDSPESSVTVRHTQEDTEPAADTLEALVREYGNTPTTGKGRVRTDVLADIRALFGNPGSQVAPNSAKPSVPVEQAVAALNEVVADKGPTMTVDRRELRDTVRDAHRSGQLTGRLLGKEGGERATAYADQAIAALALRNQ